MNLFLIGWRATGALDSRHAEAHVNALLPRLPPRRPASVERWDAPSGRLVMACAAHEPGLVGGVRYVHLERERLALFSGRPFAWTDDGEADGRGPLDARFYLTPAATWRERLDGRYAAVCYDDRDGSLEVGSDALGAYPLFAAELEGARWISNSAELVRSVLGTRELDPSAVASLVGAGWSLGGEPMWAGVRRLARGPETGWVQLEEIAAMPGAGFEPKSAARLVAAATAALADWPGRPAQLQLSGGRDSRLLLAAARAGGVELEVVSTGDEGSPDVRVARQLCEVVGAPHELRPADRGGDLQDTARLLGLTGGGGISLEDAAGYFTAAERAMWLLLNGQGGEIARAYYGTGEGLDRDGLAHALFERVAASADLLTADGRRLLEREVGGVVDDALGAGVEPRDVPDVFYLERRMAGWAATGHGCVEYAKGDAICPLWSRRLLPQELGLPVADRATERFPQATLEALSPELATIPYAESPPLRPRGADGFEEVQRRARKAVEAQPSAPAWDVLDRGRVEELLALAPGALDRRQRRRVWRVATAFMLAQ